MIIDNKHELEQGSPISTVWGYLKKYVKGESLNIVTGYFTVSALCLLKEFETEPKKFRLILGEIAGLPELQERIVDILTGDSSIANAFQLNVSAQKAIEFLRQDNVFVRMVASNFCHAKTYIYEDKSDIHSCFHVTGSSNLSEAGLGTRFSSNIELNIAEHGSDRENFKGLMHWFDDVWKNSAKETIVVEIDGKKEKKTVKEYFIDCIQNLFRDYLPEDIYYKILYELFKSDIDATLHDNTNKRIVRLEDSVIYNTLFEYQKRGVKSLINMLNKYNGAILADAVGLGKTFSALAVIKYFQNEGYFTIVLCPKKLEENWQQYLAMRGSRFERDHFEYVVRFHTDLQNDRLQHSYNVARLDYIKGRSKILLVIDESHNLRNDKSSRYEYLLKEILSEDSNADIKVLELSATPINTDINDVRNQFKLFVRGTDSGFNTSDFNIPSLSDLFKNAQAVLRKWNEMKDQTVADLINMLPEKFFNLTDRLVVARTRKMVERSERKSLGFPKKNKPINIYIGIDRIGNLTSFDQIYDALLKPCLSAYTPTKYTGKWKSGFGEQGVREMFLIKMMLTLFLKRLESSWIACKTTVEKVLVHHENTLEKIDKYLQNKEDFNFDEDSEDIIGDDDFDFMLGKSNPIKISEIIDIERFRKDVENDIILLKKFVENMQMYYNQFYAGEIEDQKFEELKKIVGGIKTERKKVLIFTSYADTAHYLYEQLNALYPNQVACVDGGGATIGDEHQNKFHEALMRFAPYSKMYNELDWNDVYKSHFPIDDEVHMVNGKWNVSFDEWKKIIAQSNDEMSKRCKKLLDKPVDILIATDCLSEGQNLQDASMVISYDIHWNPVRLIQRVGRIDRINSRHKKIDTVNFWPAKSYEDYLRLAGRIKDRMVLMSLIGTEGYDATDEIEKILKNNPVIDQNDSKLLEQLQASFDDVEDGTRTFGLEDLSFENFRQDLLDFINDRGEELRNMPNGAYSGFKTVDAKFAEVPESIVALVASPHKPVDVSDFKYKEYWLILRQVNGTERMTKVFNRQEILSLLKANISKKRNVPAVIDRGEKSAIDKLKGMMEMWMEEQIPHTHENIINNLFGGDFTSTRSNQEKKLEEKFNPNNIDLITWEYISK